MKKIFRNLLSNVTFVILFGFAFLAFGYMLFFSQHAKNLRDLNENTLAAYKDPFNTSNILLNTKLDIYKIYRTMKDIALSSDQAQIESLRELVDTKEALVLSDVQRLKRSSSTEDQEIINLFERLFTAWRPIREKVFFYKAKGEDLKATRITQQEGAMHVEKMEHSLQQLYLASLADITNVLDASEQRLKRMEQDDVYTFALLFLFSMFITLLVAFMVNKIKKHLNFLKERYEYAINGTDDGLWDWDLITNEIYFSTKWKAMLGYTDEEMPDVFDSWERNVHPDDLAQANEAIRANVARETVLYENVHRLRHKDGSWVWILDRGKTYYNSQQRAVRMVGFHTNMTKQKELEQTILENEKLLLSQSRHAAMGEMIGMIAHQWRQPLSIITMGANNLLADIELELLNVTSTEKECGEIITQAMYLSKTIDDFRDFFKQDKEPQTMLVEEIIEQTLALMKASFEAHRIHIIIENSYTRPLTTMIQELQQVLINILNNAKEALLESDSNRESTIRIQVYLDDKDVIIKVCNDGALIDEASLEKVFEPYFSTKLEKNGTGLGLYISKTIVQTHLLGRIWAKNHENGVCFFVALPQQRPTKAQ